MCQGMCGDPQDTGVGGEDMTTNEILCIGWGFCAGLTGRVTMKGIIAKIVAWFQGDLIKKIIKCLPAIVAEAEKAMADGKIDAGERKDLVMKAVDIIAAQFNIKMSGITKWVISVIVDNVAKKLPSKDIVIPDVIMKITKEIGG